jgi:predicted exporter
MHKGMHWRLLAAKLWLLSATLCAAMVLWRVAGPSPLETDLLALVPPTERNARAEAGVQAFSHLLGNRVLFLIGSPDAAQAKSLARSFADSLRASERFVSVSDQAPAIDLQALQQTYIPYRGGLLSTTDRARLRSPDFDTQTQPQSLLLTRLHQPFRAGIATDLSDDPFGFLQNFLTQLPLNQSQLTIEDGLLLSHQHDQTQVLVLAEPRGSAFDDSNQTQVLAAVDLAESQLMAAAPDARLLRTGALFYAHAARSSAEHEVDLIGGGSLLGILGLLWLMFRSFRPLIYGLMTVAIGVICATAAVFIHYEKIHLITLVFGASLIGEAIDYAIQYFAAQQDAGANWNAQESLHALLPGLSTALATSLIGYAALALTPFPAIGQVALFAFVGLGAAWISVILFLPPLLHQPVANTVTTGLRGPVRVLHWWRTHIRAPHVGALVFVLMLVSAPGWLRLAANDDIRLLIARPQALVSEETAIRQLTGVGGNGRFFLIEGDNTEEALQREEALSARLDEKIGHGLRSYVAISSFVPSAATQRNNHALLQQRLPPAQVKAWLEHAEFTDIASTKWHSTITPASAEIPILRLQDWLASPVSRPYRHQAMQFAPDATATQTDTSHTPQTALLLTLSGDDGALDMNALAHGLPGVTVVDKAASLSALFGHYRQMAMHWLPLATGIVLCILALRYGPGRAFAVLLPSLLAIGLSLALYGYSGVPVTLFTFMGLLMVLGVGANYAIFLMEAGEHRAAPFAGVLLSAATSMLSFGLLALSSMPALHEFGLIMLGGIAASVLLAPLALTLTRGKRTPCA